MTFCIAINPHIEIILQISNFYHTIQISTFIERVKADLIAFLRILATKQAVGNFHVGWLLNMTVGSFKRHFMPSIKSIIITRPQIAELKVG
jgi:hypothetical protein